MIRRNKTKDPYEFSDVEEIAEREKRANYYIYKKDGWQRLRMGLRQNSVKACLTAVGALGIVFSYFALNEEDDLARRMIAKLHGELSPHVADFTTATIDNVFDIDNPDILKAHSLADLKLQLKEYGNNRYYLIKDYETVETVCFDKQGSLDDHAGRLVSLGHEMAEYYLRHMPKDGEGAVAIPLNEYDVNISARREIAPARPHSL